MNAATPPRNFTPEESPSSKNEYIHIPIKNIIGPITPIVISSLSLEYNCHNTKICRN